MPDSSPSVFYAVVTPVGGQPVTVAYPADSPQPTAAAIQAAAQKLNVTGFAQEPAVRHYRSRGDQPPGAETPVE